MRASFVVALLLHVVSGCKRDVSGRAAARETATDDSVSVARGLAIDGRAVTMLAASELPSRAEVVALADDLAIAAAKLPLGPRGLRLLHLAADLRVRMWRVGHAEADAREAVELYRAAAKQALGAGAMDAGCENALGEASIDAELSRSPPTLYRRVFGASKLFPGGCRDAFARVLATLDAFRPSREELALIDAEVEKRKKVDSPSPSSSTPLVSLDESGVVLSPQASQGPAVKIASIQPYGSKDRARVVITLSGPTSYRVGELPGPRLFVDFERTLPSPRHDIAVGGLVDKIRQAQHTEAGDSTTRVVLDLSARAYRRIFYLPEPFRVVVDVANRPPSTTAAPPGSANSVSRIALDAGHGGNDPGAIGPSGLREKDVTLDIAHAAAPILSRELGIPTLLTRDDDRFVPLDERTARANAFHADLFVSIHCNSSESGAPRGVTTFVLDPSRDEIAAKIAARENATSLAASSHVASIASGLRLAEVAGRSTRFAELLQRSTMASLAERFADETDQGVKTAGFFVLVGAEMPSVLFEASFISNPVEEKRLSTADYRQKLASGIANAVRAYREGR